MYMYIYVYVYIEVYTIYLYSMCHLLWMNIKVEDT